MVVALGALHGQPHPDIPGGFDPVDHIFHPKFLGNHTAFIRGCMISVKSGGNLLSISRIGEQVAG